MFVLALNLPRRRGLVPHPSGLAFSPAAAGIHRAVADRDTKSRLLGRPPLTLEAFGLLAGLMCQLTLSSRLPEGNMTLQCPGLALANAAFWSALASFWYFACQSL